MHTGKDGVETRLEDTLESQGPRKSKVTSLAPGPPPAGPGAGRTGRLGVQSYQATLPPHICLLQGEGSPGRELCTALRVCGSGLVLRWDLDEHSSASSPAASMGDPELRMQLHHGRTSGPQEVCDRESQGELLSLRTFGSLHGKLGHLW